MEKKLCLHCGYSRGDSPRDQRAPHYACPLCQAPYQEMYPQPLPRQEPGQASRLQWTHVGVVFAALLAGAGVLAYTAWPSQQQAASRNEAELKEIAGVVLPGAEQAAGELCGSESFAGGAFCGWAPALADVGRQAALVRDCMEVTSVRLHPGSKSPERPDFAVSCRDAAGEAMEMSFNEGDLAFGADGAAPAR
ncbi:hypothetical protein DBB33_16515 [Chromobacterium haemolyticum]|uniref:Uncharacterized protein n=2 Tax=Chromobacterium TaxID=535 RepID=A0AAD0RQE4_9NEIS|nr:hypothetical protein D1345_11545 [Chromobacterium rhizoryzae]PTU70945.1 hypothetical protein DBB33_16515 [Chromobacterium haemolyticum]BBH13118.1 hypothetical protein CH06BL_23660 [Chromobacterium haemolyticum]